MRQRENIIPAYNRPKLEQAGERIVQLYQDWGKPEKAAEWRVNSIGAAPPTRSQ
ncbi:MAG: hypothetical protein JO182_19120 [Acidobacteriaceae bacterium]|nr:hypothetical protein [Acidobacteriaceae bacterium]